MGQDIESSAPASGLNDANDVAATAPAHLPDDIPGWRLALIFLCLSVCLLLVFMDETIVATALVVISNEFKDFQNSFWLVLGYTITFLGFAVLASRLADVYGRRLIILVGAGIFVAFSFGSGFAQSMNQLIAFRTLQGVGGSMVSSIGILCFLEMCPAHLLPLASSIIGIVIALAGSGGPILGGVFSTYTSWRWIFWINPPIAIPTVGVLYIVWPKKTSRREQLVQIKLVHVDWLGVALLLLFTTLLTISVQQAGTRVYAWNSLTVVISLVFASIAFIALIVWSWSISRVEKLRQIAEILPWRLLTDRVLVVAILTTICTGLTGLFIIVWLPVFFQIVNVLSAVQAGIHLLPLVCSSATGGAVAGIISMKNNYTWITMMLGNSLLLVGCGLFTATPSSIEVPHVMYAAQVIAGFGSGMTLTCTTMIVSLNTEFKDHALGQGLISQARILGGTLGVAMGSAVFGNHISGLTNVLSPSEISILYRNPSFIATLDLRQQVAVREAFAASFNQSLYICLFISVSSLLLSIFLHQNHAPSMQDRKAQFAAAVEAAALASPTDTANGTSETNRANIIHASDTDNVAGEKRMAL